MLFFDTASKKAIDFPPPTWNIEIRFDMGDGRVRPSIDVLDSIPYFGKYSFLHKE
jgi:hypothetical protein